MFYSKDYIKFDDMPLSYRYGIYNASKDTFRTGNKISFDRFIKELPKDAHYVVLLLGYVVAGYIAYYPDEIRLFEVFHPYCGKGLGTFGLFHIQLLMERKESNITHINRDVVIMVDKNKKLPNTEITIPQWLIGRGYEIKEENEYYTILQYKGKQEKA